MRPDDRLCSRLDHTQGEEVALKHSGVAVLGAQVDRTRLYPIVPLEESAIGAHIEQPHELGARARAHLIAKPLFFFARESSASSLPAFARCKLACEPLCPALIKVLETYLHAPIDALPHPVASAYVARRLGGTAGGSISAAAQMIGGE